MLGTKSTKHKEIEDHAELIEALKRKDPDFAEKTIRRHIFRSYRDFVELNEKKLEQPQYEENIWL
jgi:DNA-binding GntR family transcriptional regulator